MSIAACMIDTIALNSQTCQGNRLLWSCGNCPFRPVFRGGSGGSDEQIFPSGLPYRLRHLLLLVASFRRYQAKICVCIVILLKRSCCPPCQRAGGSTDSTFSMGPAPLGFRKVVGTQYTSNMSTLLAVCVAGSRFCHLMLLISSQHLSI